MPDARRLILPIVEGPGDKGAIAQLVPNLLRQLRRERRYHVDPERVIVTKTCAAITNTYDPDRRLGVEFFVRRAAREKPAAILVIVDSDKHDVHREQDGAEDLRAALTRRARSAADGIPVAVSVPRREFEAWFLADYHSLRARGHFRAEARFGMWRSPETLSGCKGAVADLLGHRYSETEDQPALAKVLSVPRRAAMRARSPSYASLLDDLRTITGA